MPIGDILAIVGMALGSAAVVGVLGWLALLLLRKRSLAMQVCVVVLASVLSLATGVIAVAKAMYISDHDLLVVIAVTVSAAVVSLAVALMLGWRIAKDARRLRQLAHDIGDGALVDAGSARAGLEFDGLAAELAATSRKLAEAREEVAAIDTSRRELIAWISHDLRTPLSGMRVMTEALDDGLATDPARFHRAMRAQVDHLSVLVDNLFELSKINSGMLVLSLEPLSLHDLISDAAAELAPVAKVKDVRLVADISPDDTLVGDPRELSRVVSNLLMNALEHTPAGGEIRVSTVQGSGEVHLAVQDTGSGIPDEELMRIFDAGWRGSAARAPHRTPMGTGGAGLGLAIVRGIVQAHKGEVQVQNLDVGCRFDVRLPREVAG